MNKVLFAMIVLFLSAPSMAKIYKWVDGNGTTHYTQTPPPAKSKAKVEEIEVAKAPKSSLTNNTYKASSSASNSTKPKESKKTRVKSAQAGKVSPDRVERHCKKMVSHFLKGAPSDEVSKEMDSCQNNLKDANEKKMKEVEKVTSSF